MESPLMMKTSLRRLLPMALSLLLIPQFQARGDDAAVVASAAKVIESMAADPNTGVPVALLGQAQGVVIVPNLINAGFVFGVKLGRGVCRVRDSKGRWGNPIHVFISGGTFGLQAGGQATEMLMVFRTKESVNRLLAGKGKITLGVDAGVAAGPAGTNVGAETDLEMRAEILSYAKSRGLFAGASLGGTGITVDRYKNSLYYDNFAVSTFQMVEGDSVVIPPEAARLKAVLTSITNPPPVEIREGETRDTKVSRSSRVRRRMDEDDASTPARPSTRRRRPAADAGDEDAAPGEARPATRRRPPADVDESVPDDLPAPTRVRPVRRPAPKVDDPADDLPPPTVRKKPAPAADDPAPRDE
jgi:lipid-binding SYLF domain-containing protein